MSSARERNDFSAPVRTIVVDDNSDFLESITAYLSKRPAVDVIDVARSGPEALELVRAVRPDLVLVDLVMPAMNGLALTRAIKALDAPPRVIVLTLADHPAYAEHAGAAGADGFLSKHEVTTRLMPLIVSMFTAHGEPGRLGASAPRPAD